MIFLPKGGKCKWLLFAPVVHSQLHVQMNPARGQKKNWSVVYFKKKKKKKLGKDLASKFNWQYFQHVYSIKQIRGQIWSKDYLK